MNQSRHIVIGFLLFSVLLFSKTDLTSQKGVANYEMDIVLDWEGKNLDGQTQLTWTNTSDIPIYELQFHMYYNAFKNTNSTFFSSRSGLGILGDMQDECRWSWTHISSFQDQFGNILNDSMQYIQPDDNNTLDQTVLKINLKEAVLPGQSQVFDFKWAAKIPKIMPRTGYNKEYLFMVQWFPKIGVLEPKGLRGREETGWNCHQYHSSGEYYANFGNYDVDITTDASLKLGFTGVGEVTNQSDEKNTWTIKAEDVIDFAWTASPNYVEIKDTWNQVDIVLLCYPGHEHFAYRFIGAIKNSLTFLEEKLGEYPYPKITIVEPPIHGLYTGGMEYPMLISTLGFCFIPKDIKATEILTTHEFIHQYFMQMVATNETEDPWMDEGFTTYYEGRIIDQYYGGDKSTVDIWGVSCSNREFNRYELILTDDYDIAPAKYPSWDYPGDSYGNVAYNKSASVLKTLEGIMGTAHFDNAMRQYFETWKFAHPGPEDFIELIDDYTKANIVDRFPNGMRWFLMPALYQDIYCDYEVVSIDEVSGLSPQGFYNDLEECEKVVKGEENFLKYSIEVKRNGELKIPIPLVCRFENSTTQEFLWDADEKVESFVVYSESPLISACLDPNFIIDLDINRINNGKLVKKDHRVASKYGAKSHRIVHYLLELASLLF